jgi:hypothetical protein
VCKKTRKKNSYKKKTESRVEPTSHLVMCNLVSTHLLMQLEIIFDQVSHQKVKKTV